MENRNFVLPRLDDDWKGILRDASSRRHLECWKVTSPVLEPFGRLEELLEAIDDRPLDESSEIVWELLSLAGDDELSRRTLLQVIVPGIASEAEWLMSWARRVDQRLIVHGDVDSMLLDAALAAIDDAVGKRRSWPIKSILRRTHRLLRRETRRREAVRCERLAVADEVIAAPASDPGAASMLVEVLNQGRERAVVTDRDVALLWLMGVEGYTTEELAPGLGVSPRSVAQRRLRAQSRLAHMVAS